MTRVLNGDNRLLGWSKAWNIEGDTSRGLWMLDRIMEMVGRGSFDKVLDSSLDCCTVGGRGNYVDSSGAEASQDAFVVLPEERRVSFVADSECSQDQGWGTR